MDNTLADHQYFKALTEASIVSKSSIDGTITYVNDYFCKISGYKKKELLGRNHNIFRHPDTPIEVYEEMWKTILKGEIWRGRIVNMNKDGSNFIAESTIIPLRNDQDEIIEFLAIRNNITKEEELREKRQVDEAKKSFLVVFTHELKTPLNAIINFSKYVNKKLKADKELDIKKLSSLLDSVIHNASDMLENITTILEISKINAKKLTYNKSLFSAHTIISQSVKKYAAILQNKNITLNFNSEEELWIHSDEARVRQLLSNILSNAIKYGGDKITINLYKEDRDVCIEIQDNGKGIADKEIVFELYNQGDTELLKHQSQGTGIGLYFTKLVCDDLNITYKLEDVKPHGTSFTFIFHNELSKKKETK